MSAGPDSILVIDGHGDVAATDGGYTFPLTEAVSGGLSAAVVPARAGSIPRDAVPGSGTVELDATYQTVLRTIEESGGSAALATSPKQVLDNASQGVFSFVLGFQNARPLADLAELETWIDRGVSVVDFAHIGNNQWVKSSRPYPYTSVGEDFDGVSPLAIEAIALLNERGVIIDTAQISVRARERIVELSAAPVLVSHNGLRAKVGEADRTISDEEVRLVADKGGLVQIVAFDGYLTARGEHPKVVADIRELRERFGLPGFTGPSNYYAVLDPETADWDAEKFSDFFREYHAKVRHDWPRSDVSRLVDAVDHVVQLVGVDHVGLASDFNHGGGIRGWLGYADTPNVTEALRERYDDADVAKIWGGNLLRLWETVKGA